MNCKLKKRRRRNCKDRYNKKNWLKLFKAPVAAYSYDLKYVTYIYLLFFSFVLFVTTGFIIYLFSYFTFAWAIFYVSSHVFHSK